MSSVIYKIVPAALWQEARQKGFFEGSPVDIDDGFIHFSTAEQSVETAARHFAGQEELLLIAIDGDVLEDSLIYEPSRGGALFPHLYGPLDLSAVVWEKPLPLGADGAHVFPEFAA